MKHLKKYNESIRDKMTPITDEEFEEMIQGDGKDKVYHVYSGVDAFVLTDENNKDIYLPYIAVIAKTEMDARIKASKILGQDLEEQGTNPLYKNYVDWVEYKYHF